MLNTWMLLHLEDPCMNIYIFFSPQKGWKSMSLPYFRGAFLLLWVWRDSIKGETLGERKGERKEEHKSFAAPEPRAAGGAKTRAVVELSMCWSQSSHPAGTGLLHPSCCPVGRSGWTSNLLQHSNFTSYHVGNKQ